MTRSGTFTYYQDKAKNEIKIGNSGFFSVFISAINFCRLFLFPFNI